MTDKSKEAKEIFRKGYNCAQSVLMAYCEDLGMDMETAAKVACGLGGGIARSRETCGAVLGGIMALGLALANNSPEEKKRLYEISRSFMDDFKKENGSVICRELLGLEEGENADTAPEKRTKEYYAQRPCEDLVGSAATLLLKYMNADE